ncbi:MAG TPA: hypothetical protein VKG24_10245 [Pseudolabrys sp.]|jgi:uncharacterized small protein (DUF1192 family)|nr:hypothetical protein [Pseudolabrys sp.]
MIKTPPGVVGILLLLWPLAAAAASSCEPAQLDRDGLSRCVDELQKDIEHNQSEIERLKQQNSLISKQLCMIAIEQHRRNTHSEALKLIIESTCARFDKQLKDDRS